MSGILGAGGLLSGANALIQTGLGIFGDSAAQKAAKQAKLSAIQAGNLVGSTTTGQAGQEMAAANSGGQEVVDAAAAGSGAVTNAAQYAGGNVVTDASQANQGLSPFATTVANASATLNAGLASGGAFNSQPTMAQIQMSPGYQFELDQGLTGVNRSAAAQGGALSGGDIKAADQYANGLAGTNYQQAFQNYETAQQNSFGNLMAASNAGQTATTQQGLNTMNAGQYAGTLNTNAATYGSNLNTNATEYAATGNTNAADLTGAQQISAADYGGNALIGAGNMTAAGTLAGANSLSAGIANGGVSLSQLLSNPALVGGTTPGVPPPASGPPVQYGMPGYQN
jgi:hypothetical protein